MAEIPDESIDMILCDLPYGTTANKWDTTLPLDKLWKQYERIISNNGAIALFGQEPFSSFLRMSNKNLYRYDWTWQKTLPTGFLQANKMPMRSTENISIFYKHLPTYNPQMRSGFKPYQHRATKVSTKNYHHYERVSTSNKSGQRYPIDVLTFSKDASPKQRIHPTQKPVALLAYLIKTYTNSGDLVMDNCMGSGSTAIACMDTGRHYVGFELDKDYYDKSLQRIKNHHSAETSLF